MLKRHFVLFLGMLGLVAGGHGVAYACDDLSSQLVARTYVLTMPMLGRDNEMIPLMRDYPQHFSAGGAAIRCMQRLGSALVQGGISQNMEYGGRSATERFGGMMPEGLEHLPGQVDDSMRSYGTDMYMMGQELLWLAEVLPAAARGNYQPYNTPVTTTRQMAYQVMPIYQMMCQMDPSLCQMVLAMLNDMTPQIEQQIYAMARQMGN